MELAEISRGEVGLPSPSEILEKTVVINKIYIALLSNRVIELSTKYPSSSHKALLPLIIRHPMIHDERIFKLFFIGINHRFTKVEGKIRNIYEKTEGFQNGLRT